MTKPVNSENNRFPSGKNIESPDDNGGKAKIRKIDKRYHAREPHSGDIAKKHEKEEQPVYPVKDAPKES